MGEVKKIKYKLIVDIRDNKKIPCILYDKKVKRCSCESSVGERLSNIDIHIVNGENRIKLLTAKYCTACKKIYVSIGLYSDDLPLAPRNKDNIASMQAVHSLKQERKAEKRRLKREAEQERRILYNQKSSSYQSEISSEGMIAEYRRELKETRKTKVSNTINYCMITLKNVLTDTIVNYTITNGSTYVTKDEKNKEIPAGCEFGIQCLRAVANENNSIEHNDTIYQVVRYVRYDATYVDTYREKAPRSANKPQKIEHYGKNVYNNNHVIYVYYKLNNTCMRDKHNIVSVTMSTKNVKTGGKIDVNVYKCLTCGKYFINYEILQGLFDKKIFPAFQYYIVESSWEYLKPVSKLMLYGYTVKEGALSERERRSILAYVVDNGLMKKPEVIHNIQTKIDFNGKKRGNERAKERWEEDILFVSTYATSKQERIEGVFARK